MKLIRKTYTTGGQKAIDFAIGFVGWIIVNAVLYGCVFAFSSQTTLNDVGSGLLVLLVALPLLINIVVLVLLGFTRYWIALGALAAFALLLIGVLLLALVIYAVCFTDGSFR